MNLLREIKTLFSKADIVWLLFGALVPALLLPFGLFTTWVGGAISTIIAIGNDIANDRSSLSRIWVTFTGAAIVIIYSMIVWFGQNDYILNPRELVIGH